MDPFRSDFQPYPLFLVLLMDACLSKVGHKFNRHLPTALQSPVCCLPVNFKPYEPLKLCSLTGLALPGFTLVSFPTTEHLLVQLSLLKLNHNVPYLCADNRCICGDLSCCSKQDTSHDSLRTVTSSSAHMLSSLMYTVHKEPQTLLVFARQASA